jgi:hypothetical protein
VPVPQIDFGPTSELAFGDFVGPLLFSLAASVATYLIYAYFYGSTHIGAGVNRTFLLGGPSITALFIGIQFSLPLSLGLLGALSFVRFRTPVKDPAEIGFLLLLIASSIGAATYNYGLVLMLYGIAAAALLAQRITSGWWPGRGARDIVITLHTDDYGAVEQQVLSFLHERLHGLRQESLSSMRDHVSLQYRFRRSTRGELWGEFGRELNEVVAPIRAEVFVG